MGREKEEGKGCLGVGGSLRWEAGLVANSTASIIKLGFAGAIV